MVLLQLFSFVAFFLTVLNPAGSHSVSLYFPTLNVILPYTRKEVLVLSQGVPTVLNVSLWHIRSLIHEIV